MFQSVCNITDLFFYISLLRRTSGRMTGWRFTPGRGCSTSSTWWRNRMETGRPESCGPSFRCTLPSETKRDTHLYDSSKKIWLRNLCVCHLQLKIPQFFTDVEVVPALLHGDLWGGNVAECAEGPVIFDPASFYGHSEYELGIAGMFGGFSSSFYSTYHEKIPKAPGFAKRNQLYQLFHYLNHWNHFGGGYRGSSIRIMKDLLK